MTVYSLIAIGKILGSNGLLKTFSDTTEIDFMIKFFEKETDRLFGTTNSVVIYMDKITENPDQEDGNTLERIYTSIGYQENIANI